MTLAVSFEAMAKARKVTGICETCGQKVASHTECEACGILIGPGHLRAWVNNYRGHVLCDPCVADWKETNSSWMRFLFPSDLIEDYDGNIFVYYEFHKEDILRDLPLIGEAQTILKWKMAKSALPRLINIWDRGEQAGIKGRRQRRGTEEVV